MEAQIDSDWLRQYSDSLHEVHGAHNLMRLGHRDDTER